MSGILGVLTVLANQPTNQWGYVAGAYVVVVGGLVAYALLTIVRGRHAGRQVPAEGRRWL